MNYQLKITKTEKNPNFVEELKDYETRSIYKQVNYPQAEIIKDALTCELTEEQFKKIKAECIKVFE